MKVTDINLNKSIPTPLYYQLRQQLLQKILDNELSVNEQIPNEADFVDKLQISRSTVRQAISELVSEGYLYRVKAKGTFVSRLKVDEGFFQKLDSFNNEMRQKGLRPSTRVLSIMKIPGKEAINDRLELPPESTLIYLCRLRFADESPVVYVETYLPYHRYADILKLDFEKHSLYTELENHCGVRIMRAVRRIEAVNANTQESRLLEMKRNAAICLVKTVAYTATNEPVEYSVARYRGDLNKFSVELIR